MVPPCQVKPFLVGNKNDHNDALAIAEASRRPRASFVPVKTLDQQDIQSLQRIRQQQIKQRTAVSNQLRGLMAEYGIVMPVGLANLRRCVPEILEDQGDQLTEVSRRFIHRLYWDIKGLDQKIAQTESEVAGLLKDSEDYQRLLTIPGVGPNTAAEALAAIGDPAYFKNGRQLAAWIGLTPRQHASGETSYLRGISKRGNSSLRRLLIHGARSVMNYSANKEDRLSRWLNALSARANPCRVIVALANKLARIIWAVLAKKQAYCPA